jgi:hypothetical protein
MIMSGCAANSVFCPEIAVYKQKYMYYKNLPFNWTNLPESQHLQC